MKKIFIIILAIVICSCSKGTQNDSFHQIEKSSAFENDSPLDLSDVIRVYELYQRSNADEQDSILFTYVDEEMCEGEVTLFDDTSFVVRLPEYKQSNIPYLASAEEFYNNCSFLWNIWSNYEVWYRGETSGELCSVKEIIKSIKAIDSKVIKEENLKNAAQNYKDSILLLISSGMDIWDDEHNPWNVRESYTNEIGNIVCHYYDNYEEFQEKYDIIVRNAEGRGKEKFQHYLKSNEAKQLGLILDELNTCENFDEQCSIWRQWANTKKSHVEDGWLVAVGKKLMESGKYNPNLNRIWITWRSICQLFYCGASKDSVIPNPFFNVYRKKCYITCLKRIEEHPDDIFAMNCAASLAGEPNVIRMGVFHYGNDAVIDAKTMMPERFEFDLSDSTELEEDNDN